MVVFLVVFLLLLLTIYFFSFIITELKISKNQAIAEQCYYLSEAGIEEAIWKLKYDDTTEDGDPAWKTEFEAEGSENWSASFSRENVFFTGGAYTVQIQNTDQAKGEITATGTYTLYPSNKKAQRIIKVKVFKALNPNPIEGIAIFTGDGDFNTTGFLTDVEITNGGIFSNEDINVSWLSDVHTTETASTVGVISETWWGNLDADGSVGYESEQQGWDPLTMPKIDFDSDDPDSYKNQAAIPPNHIYDQNEFKQMLDNASGGNCNCELHIYGITYVTGQVNVKRGTYLHVHGVLVADGTITIGQGGQTPPYDARVYVYNTGEPSGLLTKGSIITKEFATQIDVKGLLYASDSIKVTSLSFLFNIEGGIIARQADIISLPMNLIYNKDIVNTTLGQQEFSQVVTVEHWEEEY